MSGRTLNIGVPVPEYIETDEQAEKFLCLCLRKIEQDKGDLIGFDTETTGKKLPFTVGTRKPLDWMSDTVTFWSLSFKDRGQYRRWCLRGEHFRYFAPLLENPDAWFACWNAKYDAHVSWNMGINIWNAHIVDGLALAGLHDENKQIRGLKSCAAQWCGLHMTPFLDLFSGGLDANNKKIKEYETSLYDLPINKVIDYASYDAYAHLRTVEWLIEKLSAAPVDNKGYNLWKYFLDMEIDITKVLWRMERRGIPVDIEYLQSKIPVIDAEIGELEREVNRVRGKPINLQSPPQLAEFFFGPKDQGGLGLKPVKMTAGNRPSVDEEVMDLLVAIGQDVAKQILRCRKLHKTKSTYLTTLMDLSNYFEDHRIHPNFNQFGARTGRFSTDVPNSQNFPTPDHDEFGIRMAFIAPPGFRLIVADYEQLEMRIMAHMSGDKAMIQAILEGRDLHSFTVARMTPGVTYEEVVAAKKTKTPDERQKWLRRLRQDMKAVGFGIIFGAGPGKISTEIDIPDEDVEVRLQELLSDGPRIVKRVKRKIKNNPLLTEEKAWWLTAKESIASDKIGAYFDTFPDVERYMKAIPERCRHLRLYDFQGKPRYATDPVTQQQNPLGEYDWDTDVWIPGSVPLTRTGHTKEFGFVQTLVGRYRRLEDIDHSNYAFKSEAERQANNTTIQGSAADIIKAAMLRIENNQKLNEFGAEIVNQVHDELVITCPIETIDLASEEIKECMEHPFARGQEALNVPLPVDLKAVDKWGQAKE